MRYELTEDKFLTDPELERLREILAKFEKDNKRDVLLIRLALETGARASEVLAIETKDLRDEDLSVYIRGLKDSADRRIRISRKTYEGIRGLAKDGRIFNISYSRFYKIWRNYRPCKKKLHSLRHTAGRLIYMKTKDILLVKWFLGHRNLKNTEIYMSFDYGENQSSRLAEILSA